MRLLLCAAVLLAFSSVSAEQRTWTSADGSRTFDGTARNYNESRGTVAVVTPEGRLLSFQIDKLSDADQEWLRSWSSSSAGPDTDTVVGKKVAEAKLQRLEGRKFKPAELEKTPEYYLFYYSASW